MIAEQANVASGESWRLSGGNAVPPALVKELRRRTDRDGLLQFAGHVAAQVATGALIGLASGSWLLVVPAVLLHGFVMALWFGPMHECTHGTAFRTRWLNQVVGWVSGFLIWRPPLYFKYRHADHHTYTQHPELDPDIVRMPATLREYVALAFGLSFWGKLFTILGRSAIGRFDAVEQSFITESERARVRDETRVFLAIYAAIVAAALATGTFDLLLLYWIVPRIAGEPFLRLIRMAEHTGAAESPDLLENTRTVRAHPLLNFLFWNMPYHAEHHLLPSLPFHALPRLHRAVAPRLAHVSTGYLAVHRTLLRQLLDRRAAAARA
ncbi:fatty acid desaturase [Allostella humosa]|nr:fatty acid desaturase [Stella humosa]